MLHTAIVLAQNSYCEALKPFFAYMMSQHDLVAK
jgi:hypothetical protein